MTLEKPIQDKLAHIYKVPEDRCDAYNLIYNKKILPLIQEKFLAHLVSVTEDIIFEETLKKDPQARRYRIVLWKSNPKNGKAVLRSMPFGAIISYNPQNDYHDLRIFIVHELGHLLCKHKILDGGTTDNNANLFAYFAINGKDTFYKDKAPGLVYKGRELEIISRIQSVCPITKENQP